MPDLLPWLTLSAPAGLLLVTLSALRHPGPWPGSVLRAARRAGALGALGSGAALIALGTRGPWTSPVLGVSGIGFSIRLDALSVTMLLMVSFMAWVLLRFSRNYLDGDPGHGRFMGLLGLTAASVMLLVLAGNLVHLAAFWAVTSFALHRLLLFYPDRAAARVAARKKFLVARAGDVALWGAVLLLIDAFGTADLGTLLDRAAASTGAPSPAIVAATLLVALSAILKSAQFPTWGWLLEVVETPTPVSALLHAGILNGGTFLVARLGDVMVLSSPASVLLVLVGGTTALLASVIMTTQSSVKVALGYSSAAHMGFMLLLCGLGAFPVAILHLVAHSFYKAHAFLSSGSAVEAFRGGPRAPVAAPGLGRILLGTGAAVATVAGVAAMLGISPMEKPVTLGLAAILAIGLTQLWTRGVEVGPTPFVLLRTAAYAGATTLAFFALEAGAHLLLADAVPGDAAPGPTILVLLVGTVVAFAGAVLIQLRLPTLLHSPRWAAVWVHLRNGLYANAFFDRAVGGLRIPSAASIQEISR